MRFLIFILLKLREVGFLILVIVGLVDLIWVMEKVITYLATITFLIKEIFCITVISIIFLGLMGVLIKENWDEAGRIAHNWRERRRK